MQADGVGTCGSCAGGAVREKAWTGGGSIDDDAAAGGRGLTSRIVRIGARWEVC